MHRVAIFPRKYPGLFFKDISDPSFGSDLSVDEMGKGDGILVPHSVLIVTDNKLCLPVTREICLNCCGESGLAVF
uniref:Uncharacterized protein n=1 Tax=Candidatus Nitrotoga fabula TaxID=2182327 RepID=A0A2X0QTC9_9PROT|nr:protein of unknown function [Candidatus Nitrotoga fabula]